MPKTATLQQERYQLHLLDYTIWLVSLDGSIGVSVEQLFEQLGIKEGGQSDPNQ